MIIDKEFKTLIPPLSADEYSQLEKNILEYGIRDSLVTAVYPGSNGEVLIDGHNRYEISVKNGNLAYTTKRIDFPSRDAALLWMIQNQLGRRNLIPAQRIELADVVRPRLTEQAKSRMEAGKSNPAPTLGEGRVDEQIAKVAGVGKETVRKYEVVKEKASPATKEKVRSGEISINQAYRETVNGITPKPKDIVRSAEDEHNSFKADKKNGIVNVSDLKRDKDNVQILAIDFYKDISNAAGLLKNMFLFKDRNIDELINAMSGNAKSDLKKRLTDVIALANNMVEKL